MNTYKNGSNVQIICMDGLYCESFKKTHWREGISFPQCGCWYVIQVVPSLYSVFHNTYNNMVSQQCAFLYVQKKHSCTLFSHYLYLYSLVHYTFSSMKIILCMNWRRKGLAIGVYDVTFNQIISTYVICCSYCDITYNVIVAILFYNKSYNSI